MALLAAAEQRLTTAGDVDYREPPMAEPGALEADFALVVGPAVDEPVEHPPPLLRVGRAMLGGDSAHTRLLSVPEAARRAAAQASAGVGDAGAGASASGSGSGEGGRSGRGAGGAVRSVR